MARDKLNSVVLTGTIDGKQAIATYQRMGDGTWRLTANFCGKTKRVRIRGGRGFHPCWTVARRLMVDELPNQVKALTVEPFGVFNGDDNA